MSGSYLLDTNAAVDILNNKLDLKSRLDSGLEIYLCLTVVGELIFGAEKSRWSSANRARIDRLQKLCPVILPSLETAKQYGSLKSRLRRRGTPIPENDLWIGALAIQNGLSLVTQDRHFDVIEGLHVEAW